MSGCVTVNFFLSYNLAQLLLKKKLALLGTIRAHRREIPTTLNNRIELFSSVFCITMKVVCAWLCTKLKETKKNRDAPELNSYRKFCYY